MDGKEGINILPVVGNGGGTDSATAKALMQNNLIKTLLAKLDKTK